MHSFQHQACQKRELIMHISTKTILLTIIALTSITPQVKAGYEGCETLEECLPLAEQGDIYAQYTVGHLYDFGVDGAEEDQSKAIHYYTLAAKQDDRTAQSALASLLYNLATKELENTTEDEHNDKLLSAYAWYSLAAESGSRNAQMALADYFYYGDGLPKSIIRAHAWYSLAAEKNDRDAKKMLEKVNQEIKKEELEKATIYKNNLQALINSSK